MEPCGGPSIATPPFFVFKASDVPWKLEIEKTGKVNCTVENTLLPHIENKTVLTFCNDK